MKKILFLSSALIMTVCGAFAADEMITGGAGTCTVDVLGVSDNNATANTIATWSLNSYDCAAGQYLDETTLLCTECPTGSYCPGGTFTVEANNSKTACPTDYTSDAAATAESECYMGCELACSTNVECPPHSKNCTHSEFKTAGRQYVDATCNAYPSVCPIADFQCDVGYSKTFIGMKDTLVSLFGNTYAKDFITLLCGFDGTNKSDVKGIDSCDLLEPGQALLLYGAEMGIVIDFSFNTIEIDEKSPGVEVLSEEDDIVIYTIPNANLSRGLNGDHLWTRVSKIVYPGPGLIQFFMLLSEYGEQVLLSFLPADVFLAEFSDDLTPETLDKLGALLERVRSGEITNIEVFKHELNIIADNVTSKDAEYIRGEFIPNATTYYELGALYRKSSYLLKPSTIQLIQNSMIDPNSEVAFVLFDEMLFLETNVDWGSSTWQRSVEPADVDSFAQILQTYPELEMSGVLFFYLLGAMSENFGASFCYNNQIAIDWNPDNGGAHTQNMCFYESSVMLPSDPVKPGYTFMGWKLLEETTTE